MRSHSDIIKEIDSGGLEKTLINAIKRSDAAYNEVQDLEKKLQSAKSSMHSCSSNLDSILRFAAQNCNQYIVDSSEEGKHTLRVIEKDILYEVIIYYKEDRITWFSYKCNVVTE